MISFKTWLANEVYRDYRREFGSKEIPKNPIFRAAQGRNYATQALDQGSSAIHDLMTKTMYQTTDPPHPYSAYDVSYEGASNQGKIIHVMVPVEEVGNDIILAKYFALKYAIDQLKQTGHMEEHDVFNAMVPKHIVVKQTPKGQVYPIEVTFPFADTPLQRQRDKDIMHEILATRKDLPDILSVYKQNEE